MFDEWKWAGFACGSYMHFICEQDVNDNITCADPPPTSSPIIPNGSTPTTAIIISLVVSLIVLVIVSALIGSRVKSSRSSNTEPVS